SLLALGQVDDDGDQFLRIVGNGGYADEHRHTRAVGMDKLLLKRRADAALADLLKCPGIQVCMLGRGELIPAYLPGKCLLARTAQGAAACVIGIEKRAVAARERHTDEV